MSFKVFHEFRKSGGIHGIGLEEALLEDRLLEAVAKGSKNLGSKGMDLFEK